MDKPRSLARPASGYPDPRAKTEISPLCPDFVLELRSIDPSKGCPGLKPLQEKMQEYLDNGLRLGWLINPVLSDLDPKAVPTLRLEIYRPWQAVEILESPLTLSGEKVLAGFVLDLRPIFAPL